MMLLSIMLVVVVSRLRADTVSGDYQVSQYVEYLQVGLSKSIRV